MAIASGIFKQLRVKKETTWGTAAGATGGKLLRRVSSSVDLNKATYSSNEIRPDQQISDFRTGSRTVAGSINGELSVGSYSDFMAAICRKAFAAGGTTGAATASVFGSTETGFSRASGSFLTDGFKVGDVIRATGFATASLNARNFQVTNVTATALTGAFVDGTVQAVEAASAGASVAILVQGKKTFVPITGHTNDSFTLEHWFADISQSEVFTGCRVGQMDIGLPPTGIATCNMAFMGKDMTSGTSEYFTTPTAATTGSVIAAANGALYLAGQKVGLVTGMSIAINGNMTVGETVGSNFTPNVFAGKIMVSGQLTAYFQDGVIRDYFLNETEVSLSVVFPVGSDANADFLAFTMTRIKTGGAAKDDGDKGLILTMPYTALLDGSGGKNETTTITIQDSTL